MATLAKPAGFLHPAAFDADPSWSPAPHYFTFTGAPQLAALLRRPYRFFLELGPWRALDDTLERLLALAPDFALSLTTGSAWGSDIARLAAREMNGRFGFEEAKTLQLTTCLQEALMNALMHGNLELQGPLETCQEFEAFCAMAERRASLEPYKSRRILITAWNYGDDLEIAVSDEGKGFRFTDGDDVFSPAFKSGRGLFLIRSLAGRVWIGGDGRTLHMAFPYRSAP